MENKFFCLLGGTGVPKQWPWHVLGGFLRLPACRGHPCAHWSTTVTTGNKMPVNLLWWSLRNMKSKHIFVTHCYCSDVLYFNKLNVIYVLIITVCRVYFNGSLLKYPCQIWIKWPRYWQLRVSVIFNCRGISWWPVQCVISLFNLVSLYRMQAVSRLASCWGVVVLVWRWPVRCVSKDCPRRQAERSSSSKVSHPKCTTNNVAGSAVFLSPVGQLDKAIKGNIQCDVYGIVQDQNVCVRGLVVTLLLKLLAVHLCPWHPEAHSTAYN